MIYLFVVCLTVVLYVYFVYPAVLWVLTKIIGKAVQKEDITPSVTIFISAYNEEKNIEARVQNLLELDYPREKMEIFLGSDGSTDETYRIIKRLADEKKFRYAVSFQRRGKPAMINTMAKEASGEIYVFTDARQRFEKNALKELVRCFGDPEVGAVSGELLIEDKATGTGKGLGLYWEYEKALRRMESAIGSMLGATGAIYAIRQNLFVYPPENVILDDVFTPMNAIVRGHRAVFEPAARAFDSMSESMDREFSRKVRTLVGNFQIFGMFKEAFDIRKSSVALQLFSHKFMRLMVPYFLIGMLVANIFLVQQGFFFVLALILQILLYGLAILGGFFDRIGVRLVGVARFMMVPYEFCVLNFAAVVALFKYWSGEVEVKWEK
jgi:biofilm PGA synthesis N-glycosyltransferase PgaC